MVTKECLRKIGPAFYYLWYQCLQNSGINHEQQGRNALDSIYCVVAPSPTLIRLQGIELQPCVGAHLLLCNRSAALLQLGRSNEALADAVKALELSPPTFAKASHWELHTNGDRGHLSVAGAAAHAWQLCTYVDSLFLFFCCLHFGIMCHVPLPPLRTLPAQAWIRAVDSYYACGNYQEAGDVARKAIKSCPEFSALPQFKARNG